MFVGLLLGSTFVLAVLLLIDLVLQCITRSKNSWFKENRIQNYRSSQTSSIFRSETTNSNLAPIRENVQEHLEEYKEKPTFTKTNRFSMLSSARIESTVITPRKRFKARKLYMRDI